jgi:site-specific DNA-cytosine methylase
MNLHPDPLYQPIPVKVIIPKSLGTRSQRINPWIPVDQPAATICKTAAGYELKEAQIKPTCQSYRVLTGQEPKRHFGLVRLDPEKPCPTIQKSSPQSSTTGLIHPHKIRHLMIREIKQMSSFPESFRLEGSFVEKWARVGNSVPPLFMRSIAHHVRQVILLR